MQAWISFLTQKGDRYFIGSKGYFVELPDGSLAPLNLRLAFPVVNRFPSIALNAIQFQEQFGRQTQFISVPASGARLGKAHAIPIADLLHDLSEYIPRQAELGPVEQYVAIRVFESGLVNQTNLYQAMRKINQHETLGLSLLESGLCGWEELLAVCLDTRVPSKLDPSSSKTMSQRKDWELTGEILVTLDKITRTQLEYALRLKRQGNQALGQILTANGACTQEDIDECLKIQTQVRTSKGKEVALIGQLLISQGIVTHDLLEEALRSQKVARYSLERILLAMGACTKYDIDSFIWANHWHSFQDEIDDISLGEWLIKTDCISRQQLDEALRIQLRGRQLLGEMLVSMKYCTYEDIISILAQQKEIRDNYVASTDQLGSLLLKKGKINTTLLDEALSVQLLAKKPIGELLVEIDACTEDDVTLALGLQKQWRESACMPEDRLGEILVQNCAISEQALKEIYPIHVESKLPLGRVLVEKQICTPEQIIDVLLTRDCQHQGQFHSYIQAQVAARISPAPNDELPTDKVESEKRASVLQKLSTWLPKPGYQRIDAKSKNRSL